MALLTLKSHSPLHKARVATDWYIIAQERVKVRGGQAR